MFGALNNKFGKEWDKMTKEQQQPYYDSAERMRNAHKKCSLKYSLSKNAKSVQGA